MIKSVKNILIEYKSFFYLYVLFLVLLGFVLITYSKEETFWFVNSHFSPGADVFFKGLTTLGDGIFFALITLILALYRYRWALLGLIIFITSAGIAQILKHAFFDEILRPLGYFGSKVNLHTVEGVTLHVNNSFPSGHTTTAFALAVFLLFVFKLHKNGWIMTIIAILVGYSRVYLAVHFPIDVYFGSLIGVITAVIMFAWLEESLEKKFGEKGLLAK